MSTATETQTIETMSPLSAGVPGTPAGAVVSAAVSPSEAKTEIASDAFARAAAAAQKRLPPSRFTDVRVIVNDDGKVKSVEVMSLGGPLHVRFECASGDETKHIPFARVTNAQFFADPVRSTDEFLDVPALLRALDRVVAETGLQDALGAPSEWTKLVKRRAGYQYNPDSHPVVFELRCNRSARRTSRCRLIVMRIADITEGATAFTMREVARKSSKHITTETCAAGKCMPPSPPKKRAAKRPADEVEAMKGLKMLKKRRKTAVAV